MDKKYLFFFLLDPATNRATQLRDFSRGSLESYLKQGMEIIGQRLDGTKEAVNIDDVLDPSTTEEGKTWIATREYLEEKIAEIMQVVQPIVEIIAPYLGDEKKADITMRMDALKQEGAKK